jgi:hypothetical protein
VTFTTLSYNGTEKSLADWGVSTALRQVSNQAGDNMAFDLMLAADAIDPFPYGAQVTIQIGRESTAANPSNPSLPAPGTLLQSAGFSGGQVWFVGYRVDTFRTASPALEKLAYKFAGPWEFFFERLVFQKLWWTWNGSANVADWRSQVVLGMSVNALVGPNDTVPGSNATNLMSLRQQVVEIVQYVISQTAGLTAYGSTPQLQFDELTHANDGQNYDLLDYAAGGTIPDDIVCLIPDFIAGFGASVTANVNTILRAPLQAVNDVTCAEAMRLMLRWAGAVGSPVVWFDYSTSPPTLNVSTRDQLASVSLPAFATPSALQQSAGLKIKRRDDLIPSAIALKFRITSTNNGQEIVQVVNDIATSVSGSPVEGIGVTGLLQTPANFIAANSTYIAGGTQTAMQSNGRTFAAQTTTIDMEGSQTLSATIAAVSVDMGDPGSDSSAKTFWTTLFPELADVTNLAFYDATNKPATVTDQSGNPVNLSTYNYRLTQGQIAPWMNSASGPGLGVKCTVKAYFKYDQTTAVSTNSVQNAIAAWHEKTASITLTNLQGGTYSTTAVGEVIPYGLAGYIYAIESIPQYEGNFTLQETEVTDQCPLGNNLNLTGGVAEWTTMNACVQSIGYDLLKGATTLTFGPAAHLGAKDFVERLRVNRGPRWYYSIGGNIINTAGGSNALGSYTPDQGPSPNNPVPSLNILPQDLSDWLPNNSSYTAGVPGVTHDSVGSASYGGGGPSGDSYVGAPDVPLIHLADGSAGAISTFAHLNASGTLHLEDNTDDITSIIRAAIEDVPSGFNWSSAGPIKFREVTDCVTIEGTPTTVYRQVLTSGYYTSPLGNT